MQQMKLDEMAKQIKAMSDVIAKLVGEDKANDADSESESLFAAQGPAEFNSATGELPEREVEIYTALKVTLCEITEKHGLAYTQIARLLKLDQGRFDRAGTAGAQNSPPCSKSLSRIANGNFVKARNNGRYGRELRPWKAAVATDVLNYVFGRA